jgi:uncharacterized membrane protein YedE/YeeE
MTAHFTPWLSLSGGILLGLAASLLLLLNGRVAGISGICAGLFLPEKGDLSWRLLFVGGLLLGGLATALLHPAALHNGLVRSVPALLLAGLLVGGGARLANGCTSGHGLCGLSRLSPRSFVAVATFIATGSATVALVNRVWGGSP